MCTVAASKNKVHREHKCLGNWDRSAKASEADMVTEMVLDVQNSEGMNVDGITGGEDTTTVAGWGEISVQISRN